MNPESNNYMSIPNPEFLDIAEDAQLISESDATNVEISEIDADNEKDQSFKSWLGRHKIGATLGVAAVGAVAIVAPEMAETAEAIADNASWAVPTLVATEVAWNSGAAMMLISAGKKIGKPWTLHQRIGELMSSVSESKLFRAGLAVNVAGEIGTASVLTAGSIAELPPESWPITMGGAAVLMAPGVGLWVGIHRHRKNQALAEAQSQEGEI